ncbi:MAG: heparan-alpha-glucosaminide N-acetyltransferase domain-containing protein [Henriciella sp.]|nr:heparan-alpha-glucosaminide N-acetyltransferase domain-containing protein [Henriciella sp.]
MQVLSQRIASIDALRGIVIILMALDHVRDYFHASAIDPTDLAETTPELFMTRWVTHFCAPIFVLLAGMSAGFMRNSGKTKLAIAQYLVKRGLFLVALEFTIVAIGWQFKLTWWEPILLMQVIWVLGASMILLAGALFMPRIVQAIFVGVVLLGHNLLPWLAPDLGSTVGPIWTIFYGPGMVEIGGQKFFALYSLLPWFGVMLFGYLLSGLYQLTPAKRRRVLLISGFLGVVSFILIRALNVYGDPGVWAMQPTFEMTVLSFINTAKYPPSLLFLLMTLSPAFLFLAFADQMTGPIIQRFVALGQASLFFYLIHIFYIHGGAILIGAVIGFDVSQQFKAFYAGYPASFGFGLLGVYAVWSTVVVTLYPLCIWYAGKKRQRAHPILSYI